MKTKVVFRRWIGDGSVIAIFPELTGLHPYFCMSYEHIGQHGECNPFGVLSDTYKCSPSEYQSLKAELEDIGYKLEVVEEDVIPEIMYSNESWLTGEE